MPFPPGYSLPWPIPSLLGSLPSLPHGENGSLSELGVIGGFVSRPNGIGERDLMALPVRSGFLPLRMRACAVVPSLPLQRCSYIGLRVGENT